MQAPACPCNVSRVCKFGMNCNGSCPWVQQLHDVCFHACMIHEPYMSMHGFHAWHDQILMALVVCACKGSFPQHATAVLLLGMHGVHATFLHWLAAMYKDCKGCHAHRCDMHVFSSSCMHDSWNMHFAWTVHGHAWVSNMTWPSSHGIGCHFLQRFMFTKCNNWIFTHDACLMGHAWHEQGSCSIFPYADKLTCRLQRLPCS